MTSDAEDIITVSQDLWALPGPAPKNHSMCVPFYHVVRHETTHVHRNPSAHTFGSEAPVCGTWVSANYNSRRSYRSRNRPLHGDAIFPKQSETLQSGDQLRSTIAAPRTT